MPGYRTHVCGGVLAYIGALFLAVTYFIFKPTLWYALEWFICSILGSLFPDVDIKSKGQILFYRVVTLCLLLLLWKRQIVLFTWLALLSMLPVLSHHRGLFHKIWFIILVPFASALLLAKWYPGSQNFLLFDAFFFSVGAISHILLDSWQTRLKKLRF